MLRFIVKHSYNITKNTPQCNTEVQCPITTTKMPRNHKQLYLAFTVPPSAPFVLDFPF